MIAFSSMHETRGGASWLCSSASNTDAPQPSRTCSPVPPAGDRGHAGSSDRQDSDADDSDGADDEDNDEEEEEEEESGLSTNPSVSASPQGLPIMQEAWPFQPVICHAMRA
jgi:hypothetical protein